MLQPVCSSWVWVNRGTSKRSDFARTYTQVTYEMNFRRVRAWLADWLAFYVSSNMFDASTISKHVFLKADNDRVEMYNYLR